MAAEPHIAEVDQALTERTRRQEEKTAKQD